MRNDFSFLKNFLQGFGAEYVAESGGRQKPRRVLSILHVGHRHDRIKNSKIDNGVDSDGHGVLGEYFLWSHVECDRPQVDYDYVVDARKYKK